MAQRSSVPASLVLTNATVLTMDPRQPSARAVVVGDGLILAVGSDDEARSWVGTDTRVLDLGGRILLPGFFDSHNHMLRTGVDLRLVELASARSVADVLEAVRRRAAEVPAGTWIESSFRWHESQLAEQRFPRREELDAAAPDHPVILRRGGHNAVCNSLAFQLAGITRDTPDPPGGTYVKDPDTGDLIGHIVGANAYAPVVALQPKLTHADRVAAIHAIQRRYAEAGITSVIEPGLSPEEMAAFRDVAAQGESTVRVDLMWRLDPGTTDRTLQASLDTLRGGEVVRDLTDPWVRTLAIKLSADGGVEAGYHREPYAYADDPTHPHGKPRISPENMNAFCEEAARLGWQVGIHCVGDAAIDEVLDAFEAANRAASIVDGRWTLIHMMAADGDHFPRANALRLAITAQQPLQYALAAGFVKYLGPQRARNIEPLRMYLRHSRQPVGGGSDSPVTPYQPLLGIWSSVTRATEQAGVQGPEWAITAEDALRMYTVGSAWCAFGETVKGTLEAGKYADLVALSADPRQLAPEALHDLRVDLTVAGGLVVHETL